MPKQWVSDDYAAKRKDCHIPDDTCFQTKNDLVLELIQQAVASVKEDERLFLQRPPMSIPDNLKKKGRLFKHALPDQPPVTVKESALSDDYS